MEGEELHSLVLVIINFTLKILQVRYHIFTNCGPTTFRDPMADQSGPNSHISIPRCQLRAPDIGAVVLPLRPILHVAHLCPPLIAHLHKIRQTEEATEIEVIDLYIMTSIYIMTVLMLMSLGIRSSFRAVAKSPANVPSPLLPNVAASSTDATPARCT